MKPCLLARLARTSLFIAAPLGWPTGVLLAQAPTEPSANATAAPKIRILTPNPAGEEGRTLSNANVGTPLQAIGPTENYGVYKHVDERGRVTYTNFPVRGAQRMELEPLPPPPVVAAPSRTEPAAAAPLVPGTSLRASTGLSAPPAGGNRPAVAVVSVPAVDRDTQKKRDDDRRKILETELAQEEKALATTQALLEAERKNNEALQKTLAEMAVANITSTDAKRNVERTQERARSLQLTLSEHNRNIDALRKELGSVGTRN
jgi:hypothetical protein